jgi:hypothetical protein
MQPANSGAWVPPHGQGHARHKKRNSGRALALMAFRTPPRGWLAAVRLRAAQLRDAPVADWIVAGLLQGLFALLDRQPTATSALRCPELQCLCSEGGLHREGNPPRRAIRRGAGSNTRRMRMLPPSSPWSHSALFCSSAPPPVPGPLRRQHYHSRLSVGQWCGRYQGTIHEPASL